jgi:hypothetical protein
MTGLIRPRKRSPFAPVARAADVPRLEDQGMIESDPSAVRQFESSAKAMDTAGIASIDVTVTDILTANFGNANFRNYGLTAPAISMPLDVRGDWFYVSELSTFRPRLSPIGGTSDNAAFRARPGMVYKRPFNRLTVWTNACAPLNSQLQEPTLGGGVGVPPDREAKCTIFYGTGPCPFEPTEPAGAFALRPGFVIADTFRYTAQFWIPEGSCFDVYVQALGFSSAGDRVLFMTGGYTRTSVVPTDIIAPLQFDQVSNTLLSTTTLLCIGNAAARGCVVPRGLNCLLVQASGNAAFAANIAATLAADSGTSAISGAGVILR